MAVDEVLAGHDAVVHFAAESHVDRSMLDPDVFMRTNCDGTNVVCDLAGRHGVERFLHVSTDEVYGSIEEGSFVETDRLVAPLPVLGGQGGLGPDRARGTTRPGLPVLVTRSSNQYGPYQFPEKLIPLFVTNLLDGQKSRSTATGRTSATGCSSRDNCEAVDLVLRQGAVGEIYNVGGGNEMTNREVTSAVLELLDCTDERIDHVEDRLGHDRRYSISSEKVAALGWSPRTAFADGLEETVAFYRDRREWWEPLLARVGR